MIWLILIFLLYLSIIVLGTALLWMSYQVKFRKRYSLIRDQTPVPVADAMEISNSFAILLAVFGVAVLLFAIAIPVIPLGFGTWPPYLGFMGALAAIWRHILFWRLNRKRALERGLK
jgi:hypothetical protein